MSKIKKVVIAIGEKEVELTLDEAKELKDILGSMFSKDEIIYIKEPYPVYQYRYWYQPKWNDHEIIITCSSNIM